MSIEKDCAAAVESVNPDMLRKVGIKLWADGSPWVGTIATSFPYADSELVRTTMIPRGPSGEKMMNYTREELDATLDKIVSSGYQMAFHVNGDVGLDIVLDAYERSLNKFKLVGTDHRWRVEHVGGARPDQFKRAASLGVGISMSPFQFTYWGDVLDGQLFAPEIGSQWQRYKDAFDSGAVVSFHNDGMVSPPNPLLNIKGAVTRTTPSGKLHGPEQKITLDQAFGAHTVNAAHHLKRDDLGSITIGKLADFVELSADPWTVDPMKLAEDVHVHGTWINGKKIDIDSFLSAVLVQTFALDPKNHNAPLHDSLGRRSKCC
jgi:predicted amidohydrolase YtcJ